MNTLHNIPLKTIQGQDSSLEAYAGKVILVVNVASKCGLTPQYTALEKLYETYRDRGLVVAGFPANEFGAQEPGTNAEIAEFCSTTFNVAFPLFEKITVVRPNKHPLYDALTRAQPGAIGDKNAFREDLKKYGLTPTVDPEVVWNFEKFLLNKRGEAIARFAPDVTPDDPRIVQAIEAALAN